MMKEFIFPNLNIRYCRINGYTDSVLTSDGVFIKFFNLKNMTLDEYNEIKKDCSLYDYKKSKECGKLILIDKKWEEDDKMEIDENNVKTMEKSENIDEIHPKNVKITETSGEIKKEPKKQEKKISKKKSNSKMKKLRNFFKSFTNVFFTSSRIIMFVVCIGTGILSIYFTGNRMYKMSGNLIIGYLISITMYFFGVIGLNFADVFREKKKYFQSCVFLILSLLTIGFSMLTSFFENGERYYEKFIKVENTTIVNKENQAEKINLLKDMISDKKLSIENLNIQNEKLSKTYVTMWTKEGNVVVEGKITELAQNNINENNEQIKIYENELSKLNNELMILLDDGIETNYKNDEKNIETFDDLIYNYTKVKGNILQFFMLIFCSIFIDIISPLALIIVRQKE